MYAGLRRMLDRAAASGTPSRIEVAVVDESREIADAAWRENNLIKAYFEQSGLWRRLREDEKPCLVATNGLRQKMLEWARVSGDNEFAADLERDPRVLGKMLQAQRAAGFVAINNATGALWQGPTRQCRAWQVPYAFDAQL
jgi:hypothetical protein